MKKLVKFTPITGTSTIAIEFSPKLQFAEHLFEDTEKFIILFDEGGPESHLFVSKEDFQEFIVNQSMLSPLKEHVEEDYFLSLVQFAWNLVLTTLEEELAAEWRVMQEVFDHYDPKFLEELKKSAEWTIKNDCLPKITKRANQLACDQKHRGNQPDGYL
ncbi:MAG: hypothetical protein GF308_08235 [Candidatus Heimdallarchaeota archaeon]|nr:hypothetical protein [Candidatus Heimdallarchaeota archaeon]